MLASLLPLLWQLGLDATAAKSAERVTIFAAASTGQALEEIAILYGAEDSAEHDSSPPTEIQAVIAASSTLARQINAGAPADLYLSANQRWMDYLKQNDLVDPDSITPLLGNELVLIVPSEASAKRISQLDHESLISLAEGRIAIADSDHVPAGLYARQALEFYGVWSEVATRAARTADVRGVLALVARGEVSAGIVYRSDTVGRPAIRIIAAFPADSHAPIIYLLAVVAERRSSATDRFFAYLRSPIARDVFRRHGFTWLDHDGA